VLAFFPSFICFFLGRLCDLVVYFALVYFMKDIEGECRANYQLFFNCEILFFRQGSGTGYTAKGIICLRSLGGRSLLNADEGESRSNRSTPYTIGVGFGMLKLSRGGRCIITTHGTALGPSSRKTGALTSPSHAVGCQAALDSATAEAA
jgi:hypothetical protein